jgi:hypothetical protein
MVVVRAYPVMGSLTVEVTCAGHGMDERQGAHLLIRADEVGCPANLGDLLQRIAEVVDFARREWVYGELESFDDCSL